MPGVELLDNEPRFFAKGTNTGMKPEVLALVMVLLALTMCAALACHSCTLPRTWFTFHMEAAGLDNLYLEPTRTFWGNWKLSPGQRWKLQGLYISEEKCSAHQ